MASKFDNSQLSLLKQFVDLCKEKPELLHAPQLKFFRDWLESLGANIPPPPEKPKEPEPTEEAKTAEKDEPMTEPEPKEEAPTEEAMESSSEESDVEIDREGCIEPDNDEPQQMGDASIEDPEVVAAFQDLSQNPANISKYEDNPKVKKISGDEFGEKRKENGEKWKQLFETLSSNVINELCRLRKELKIGDTISHNLSEVFFMVENELRPSNFQFTEVGGGGFGDCYLVHHIENGNLPFSCGTFIAKKLKEGDHQEIVQEIARILLITTFGHYGIVEAKTFEWDGKLSALVLGKVDSSQNITMYVTMNYIEGKSLEEVIERKELTDFDRLRIAVRVANTLQFLHSYKLAHCDLKLDNIMLKKDSNDPVLIDLGNMRTNLNADFSTLDSSSYHVMIYRLFKDCQATQIPPVVKPIFDKWDDEDHMKMPLADLTKKYFGKLSAYNADISIFDSSSGLRNTVPRRSGTCIGLVDFEAIQSSKSLVEYQEKVVMTLDENDKMIRDYVEAWQQNRL